jgi:hypothetical protein
MFFVAAAGDANAAPGRDGLPPAKLLQSGRPTFRKPLSPEIDSDNMRRSPLLGLYLSAVHYFNSSLQFIATCPNLASLSSN